MKNILLLLFVIVLFSCQTNTNNKTEESTPPVDTAKNVQVNNEPETTIDTNATINGIDVSHFQGKVDWSQIKKDSLVFAICKATQGTTYTDPNFEYNWNGIKDAGLIRGVYHFYESQEDPEKQADNFLSAVSVLGVGDLPAVLDIEWAGYKKGTDKTTYQNGIMKWLQLVEQKTGKKPMIYASPSFVNEYLSLTEFADYDLWLAEYSENAPTIPTIWKDKGYKIWQNSSTDVFQGITGQVDHDIFNGNINAINEFVGL